MTRNEKFDVAKTVFRLVGAFLAIVFVAYLWPQVNARAEYERALNARRLELATSVFRHHSESSRRINAIRTALDKFCGYRNSSLYFRNDKARGDEKTLGEVIVQYDEDRRDLDEQVWFWYSDLEAEVKVTRLIGDLVHLATLHKGAVSYGESLNRTAEALRSWRNVCLDAPPGALGQECLTAWQTSNQVTWNEVDNRGRAAGEMAHALSMSVRNSVLWGLFGLMD